MFSSIWFKGRIPLSPLSSAGELTRLGLSWLTAHTKVKQVATESVGSSGSDGLPVEECSKDAASVDARACLLIGKLK